MPPRLCYITIENVCLSKNRTWNPFRSGMCFPHTLCDDYWICFRRREGVTLLCYEMPRSRLVLSPGYAIFRTGLFHNRHFPSFWSTFSANIAVPNIGDHFEAHLKKIPMQYRFTSIRRFRSRSHHRWHLGTCYSYSYLAYSHGLKPVGFWVDGGSYQNLLHGNSGFT